VAEVQRLDEPEIYANRLLGIKINTTDKIIMRKKDGKVVKDIHSLAGEPRYTAQSYSGSAGSRVGSVSGISAAARFKSKIKKPTNLSARENGAERKSS
jgi:hypothetical protein